MAVLGEEAGWAATVSLRAMGVGGQSWLNLPCGLTVRGVSSQEPRQAPTAGVRRPGELTGLTLSLHKDSMERFSQTKASRRGKTNTSVTLEIPWWSSG